jgi:hypothetical protein
MTRLAALPLLLCTIGAAQEGRRCATPLLTPKIMAGLKSGAMASGFQMRQAAGRMAATPSPRQAHSEHFTVVWMPSAEASRDTLSTAMNTPLPGDTIPESIRLSLTTLEDARRLIVDTLGMRPPLPAPSSWHWGIAPLEGRFVVELLKVDAGSFPDMLSPGLTYFALTLPRGDAGHCNLAIASNWIDGGLPGWSITPDTASSDAHAFGHNYATDWRSGLAATVAHELMHASQFRYERPTVDPLHFFYEASAVAFEERATPWTMDWPQFAKYLYGSNNPLDAVLPWYAPYAQGLFVQGLYQDCQAAFQGTFWNDRERNGGDVLQTMQRLGQTCNADLPTLYTRHSLRLMASGRRSSWLPQALGNTTLQPFRLASLMPRLRHDTLRVPSGGAGQFLSNQSLSLDFRSLGPQGRHVAVILGTPTPRTLAVAGDESLAQDPEFLLLPPSPQARWIGLVNPTREVADSWFATVVAPDPDTLKNGMVRAWSLPHGRLSGTAVDDATARVWNCFDCWKPHKTDAFFASADSARIYKLYDFHRALRLHSTTVSLPLPPSGTGKVYRLAGAAWTPLSASVGPTSLDVTMDTLDLRTPATFLVIAGTGNSKAQVEAPYPNPARLRHGRVHFRMKVWSAACHLTIHAADGTLVASLRPQEGSSEIVWNLASGNGSRIAPGLYFYHWESARGAVEGRILVGH